MKVGIIAEDRSDCEALSALVRRFTQDRPERSVGIKTKSGKGCCRISRKASPTMKMWARDGISGVVIVHDLDRNAQNGLNDEAALRQQIESVAREGGVPFLVCIPVEELEAWFWCDQNVLDIVARQKGKGKAVANPHLLVKPKEMLEKLSVGENGKASYDTYQNVDLAQELDLGLCASRCESFAKFKTFVEGLAV